MTSRAMNMSFETVDVRRNFDAQANRAQEIARHASNKANLMVSSVSRKVNSIPEIQSLRTGSIDGISKGSASVKDKAFAIASICGFAALLSTLAFFV